MGSKASGCGTRFMGFSDNRKSVAGRLCDASRCSLAGLKAAWRHESAFRQEVSALIVIVPAALWLGKNGLERALLLGVWILVLTVELINSALEAVVDRIGLDAHELSGRAKDLGSAAVLCALVLAAAVWIGIVVFP
jgi:diacylglycerol kinase (ATP)